MAGVIFPDIEAHLIGYLKAALGSRSEEYASSVWVGNQVPAERRNRMVTVRDDGGPVVGDVRAVARLGVNVWGGSQAEASDLANLVSALVGASADGAPVLKATTTRPYSVADDAGQAHQYFTAELIVRGTSL
jgi:hypothetical protein